MGGDRSSRPPPPPHGAFPAFVPLLFFCIIVFVCSMHCVHVGTGIYTPIAECFSGISEVKILASDLIT